MDLPGFCWGAICDLIKRKEERYPSLVAYLFNHIVCIMIIGYTEDDEPIFSICVGLKANEKCEYLYYVIADKEGGHVFAATFAQHEANIVKAKQAGVM